MEIELRLEDVQGFWEATDHIELAHASDGALNYAATASFHLSFNLLFINAF
jgi:hypothetical protein